METSKSDLRSKYYKPAVPLYVKCTSTAAHFSSPCVGYHRTAAQDADGEYKF